MVAATAHLFLKHDDRAVVTLVDDQGNEVYEHEGYLPHFPDSVLGGDQTILKIDNVTGRIIGWKPLDHTKLEDGE